MERCPNCGAPARPGAKFCTTCGFRLSESSATSDPAADEATADPSRALPPNPDDDSPLSPTVDEFGQDPAAAAASGEIGETDRATANDGLPAQDSEDEAPADADQVLSSSWPAPEAAAWSSEWQTGDNSSETEPEPDRSAEPAPEADAIAAWPPPPASIELEAEEEVESSIENVDEQAPANEFGEPPSSEAIPLPASGYESPSDAAARAASLLDELRALLPELSAPAPAPAADLEPIAADLEAAIAALDEAEAAEQAALRVAMDEARTRPRDIDTVLDLSRRVDAVIALIDAHDRCVAAIERAVTALRGGSGSGSGGGDVGQPA
jgi:hypothetical protein